MKSYEEKLVAAASEVHEKWVFRSRKPAKISRIWIFFNQRLGWELPPLTHMSFWQIFAYYGIIVCFIKIAFDALLFSKIEFMTTTKYWEGFAIFVLLQSICVAGLFRGIARWHHLSRWEDL